MTPFRPFKKLSGHQPEPAENFTEPKPQRTRAWQAIVLTVASILVFFLLMEGGLALVGVNPAMKHEDPFVGFASNVPLYVPETGPRGATRLVTAPNKSKFFNAQSFSRDKAAGTYRIFTLGGSTTYGRPYNDTTSFSGWLRELLPQVDSSKTWEVINAGGISYASYRVAHLMEELIAYEPDLFIVYTGHNEFLEERTYGELKEMPAVIRSTVGMLSRTRTWTAMNHALQNLGVTPQQASERDRLGSEVNTILDRSAGLDRYTRDDPLREKIFEHYRISLERMAALARSAGAEILFVTPASSLNDCAPFKSEHTDTLDAGTRTQVEQLLAEADAAIAEQRWDQALDLLNRSVSLDPRHAGLQYRRGRVLLALKRFNEAALALHRARDEDVCPLRALTPMQQIVTEVARGQGAPMVDYIALLSQLMQQRHGYPIPGHEFFLDHVHPTIEGHQLLAVQIIKALAEEGIAQPSSGWEDHAVEAAETRINARIDKGAHALALVNLARVMLWAGKDEEAARLAGQARQVEDASEQVRVSSTSIQTSILLGDGHQAKAVELLYATLAELPGALEIRMKLGEILNDADIRELEKAAAHLLLVCQQMPQHDDALTSYALVMAQRGRLDTAFDSTAEALRINPKNTRAQRIQAKIRSVLKNQTIQAAPFEISLEIYPSRAPRKLVQMRKAPNGRRIPHGIDVEFYQNGRLKSFKDLAGGRLHGLVKNWDEQGNVLNSTIYRQGEPVLD